MLVFQVLKLIPSTFIQTLETLQRPALPIKEWYRQVLVDFNANQQHAIPHALSELTKRTSASDGEILLFSKVFIWRLIKFTNSGMYSSCRHEKWEEPLYDQDLFLAIHQHLSANDVEFFHGDYSRLIENCKADDLVFFDLPYYNTNCKFLYSTELFDADAHKRLAADCKNLVDNKCHIIQTNSDEIQVKKMYQRLGFTVKKTCFKRKMKEKSWQLK